MSRAAARGAAFGAERFNARRATVQAEIAKLYARWEELESLRSAGE